MAEVIGVARLDPVSVAHNVSPRHSGTADGRMNAGGGPFNP
jgi:hypothetical protein